MNYFSASLVLAVVLLQVTVKTNLVPHDNNHGVLTSTTVEGYSPGHIPDFHLELPPSITGSLPENIHHDDNEPESLLKFEPAFLDFQERQLGIPYLQKVTLFNTDKNRSIDMKSISGNTVHFHSSFFEDKHIPPLGNTSFNVVFLGRNEGTVESDLLIHTTKGHFKFKVKGASVSSSYRIRPIVGIKLPQNTTFSSLIYMYNPHIEPIQITEVYSTGGNFHLELPTGEVEGPKKLWEIAPLQTKAVIRVKFHSHTEQNHTAYIRFKLNNTKDILAVPLEVEVTSSCSLYTSQGFLDFGVGGSLDAPKSLNLYLRNLSKKGIKVDSIMSISKSINIKYDIFKVGPESLNDNGTNVATVTLDWKLAYENQEFSGKIIITYNNGQNILEVPYYVTILEGSLLFDPSAMTYFINELPKALKSRDFTVKNNFSLPLAITSIVLPEEADKYFYMSDFKRIILKPGEEAKIFTLNLKKDILIQNLKLNSFIILNTNISAVKVQILSYNGKLHVDFPYKSKDGLMDLGLIGIDVRKEIYFVINNFNTAVININKITTSLPLAEVEIIHCNRGNYTDALIRNLSYTVNTCDKLESDEFAIIRLSVQSTYMEGQIWGTILIETQFENLTIPVHYKVAQGRIEIGPEPLIFEDCFPGKICSHPLRIHSTFNDPMIIEKIVSIPPNPRLSSEHSGHIMARSSKSLGYLYLNPAAACLDECYLGLNFIDSVGWLHTMMLPSITSELDLRLATLLYNRYLNETSNGLKRSHNITLKLDTSEVKWHIFDAHVVMTWPSLVLTETVLDFPLTQLGDFSYFNVTLYNPSDRNLVIQLVLSLNYPEFQKLNDGLLTKFLPDYVKNSDVTPSNSAFFFNEKLYLYRVLFKTLTGLDSHEATLPLLLPPGKNFTFSIGFDAEEPGFNAGFLYIRNNLTVMEVIQLSGRVVVPNFKFGNRRAGSDVPLLFELSDKQLKDCETKRRTVSNLSVRRSFTARNLGDIAITIGGFYIERFPCEGFGFKVLNCESFVLPPNSTRKIDIGFMPDFTMTKLIRTLTIDTSLSYRVSYTMVASIPAEYLLPCATTINRPVWEPSLYYTCLCVMCILLIIAIGMIIADAEHSLKISVNVVSRTSATVQPPLDLRQVGAQTRLEIHSNHAAKEEPQERLINAVETITDSNVENKNHTSTETDKYSVLIPTTGKSKKKLKEDELENNHEKRKKSWLEARKLKNKAKDAKKGYLSNKEYKKELKKHEMKKYEPEEEETYSVSTDSSNNEEIDNLKIIGSKSRISLKNRRLLKTNRIEEQSDGTYYYKDFKKISGKSSHRNKEKEKSENKEDEVKQKITKNPSKEYVDKRILKRKLSLEKKSSDKNLSSQINPTQFTVWGENKASFSDIVARNDSSPVHFMQPTAPPVCKVEPQSIPMETYRKKRDLGPIGSRKTECKEQRQFGFSNSFFSDNSFGLENSSKAWDHLAQPTSVSPKRECSQQSNMIVSGIWENVTKQNAQNSMNFSSSSSHEVGSYLWGSSSVWKPWEPSEVQRSRPRTPPGFVNSSTSDAHENVPVNQKYDLFGMTNIWARQYPNPWNSNPNH